MNHTMPSKEFLYLSVNQEYTSFFVLFIYYFFNENVKAGLPIFLQHVKMVHRLRF